jgi:hypothetical protein
MTLSESWFIMISSPRFVHELVKLLHAGPDKKSVVDVSIHRHDGNSGMKAAPQRPQKSLVSMRIVKGTPFRPIHRPSL